MQHDNHMDIEIKEAAINDITTIKKMAEIVFRKTYEPILSKEQIDYMMEWMYSAKSIEEQYNEGHKYFIASIDGTPCGYMSIKRENISEYDMIVYHLHKLYIMPEKQGNGVGKMLFIKACSYARENTPYGKIRIELNVNRNNPSLNFYKRMGMHILKEGDFAIGKGYYMNDYIMGINI